MIVINDLDNVNIDTLKRDLDAQNIDVSFSDLVVTPIFLSLNQLFNITNLALQTMIMARYNKNQGMLDLADEIYNYFIEYESKLGNLSDIIDSKSPDSF